MKVFLAVVFVLTALPAGQRAQTFTGVITDDACARDGHGSMRMGPTDAECTRLCVMIHDAAYVLSDGKAVYSLTDQVTPEEFAGQRVRVVGTLDATTNTIQVESIAPAD